MRAHGNPSVLRGPSPSMAGLHRVRRVHGRSRVGFYLGLIPAPLNALKSVRPVSGLPQTSIELQTHFREQLRFLHTSARYFDSGTRSEAKRMATALRILFHDSDAAPSLTAQLRIRDSLSLSNTVSGDCTENLFPYSGLTMARAGPDVGTYEARLGFPPSRALPPDLPLEFRGPCPTPPDYLPFEPWWSTIVISDKKGVQFTRGELVLVVSEADGGVGVSPTLDPKYLRLSRENALGWTFNDRPLKALNSPRSAKSIGRFLRLWSASYRQMPRTERPNKEMDLTSLRLELVIAFRRSNRARKAPNPLRVDAEIPLPIARLRAHVDHRAAARVRLDAHRHVVHEAEQL